MYDGVLRLLTLPVLSITGFADDTTVVTVEVETAEEMERVVNATMETISTWMNARGFKLVPEKTEAVVVSGKRWIRPDQISLSGRTIPTCEQARVLGVDRYLSFKSHISRVAARAAATSEAFNRIMPNVGGEDS